MKNWWLKLGCFLTGYSYPIVMSSSEVAVKTVKRTTSALLIVCILWSFIGYTFTERYLKGSLAGSIVGGVVMCIIVIQIERQIILAMNVRWPLLLFRAVIAIIMALIGSIIIDQLIFREDIQLQKIQWVDEKVKRTLPTRTEDLKKQIAGLNADIDSVNAKIDWINSQPIYLILNNTKTTITSSHGSGANDKVKKTNKRENITTQVLNPIRQLLPGLLDRLKDLYRQKAAKENKLLTIRPSLIKELNASTGFLDELQLMFQLVTGSKIALFVWLMWIFFFLGIELFILVSKLSDKGNDYDSTVEHQMKLQIKKLELLSRAGEG